MIDVVNLTMDGTDQAYTIPADCSSLAMHSKGGAITMRKTAAGPGWTIEDKEKESIDTRAMAGEKIYFNGAAGVVMELRLLKGVL